jgi:hypothetical protein
LGLLPGWPGAEVYPPQPMIGQTRRVLERYAENGGKFAEVVMENTGHVPFVDDLAGFNAAFHNWLES